MLFLKKNAPVENRVVKGETLDFYCSGMTPVTPMFYPPLKKRKLKSIDLICTLGDGDGEYCGDDTWMMSHSGEDPLWEGNDLQYPWEMEKSCYEYDVTEEGQE